jgi:hypothetical protein
MRSCQLGNYLSYPLLATALLSGCQSLYDYKPVPVLVRNAETQKPIPGADVHISHPLARSSFSPYDSSGKTGIDGIARLQAACFADQALLLEARGPGYMTYVHDIADDTIRQIKSRGWFEAAERRPPAIIVEMYAEPRFFVELVVPTGYRGLVKAAIEFKDDVPCRAGQRGFDFEVASTGEVQVLGPSLLRRYPPIFQARYADGSRLNEEMDMLKVGFRWLKHEDDGEYFVVGTQADYDHLRRELVREPSSQSGPPASDRGGHKGGRRRGIQVME